MSAEQSNQVAVTEESPIDGWRPNEVEALNLFLLGRPHNEIAEAAGISPKTLYTWRRRPKWKAAVASALAERHEMARHLGQVLTLEAVEQLASEMRAAKDSADRQRAAVAILDRFGHPKGERVELTATVTKTEDTPAEAAARLARAMGGPSER